jgi:MerR family transcriptional regulator, light-induced transcriptional regulator
VKEEFSLKQVVRAIGVSESSLKRWCDQGLISTLKTAGGHHRIPLEGTITFLRASQRSMVRPELLGLSATSGNSERVFTGGRERLNNGLLVGDEPLCRQIIFDLWLAGQRLSVIGDQVIAPAFADIGEKWARG